VWTAVPAGPRPRDTSWQEPAGYRGLALGERLAALRERFSALGRWLAALGQGVAALRERFSALGRWLAALGQGVAALG
jgi:hypothetical protein